MRFDALDACRGLAALMVALQRLEAHGYHASLGPVRNAYLFVDFFFVLSGFVIAHSWGDRLETGRQLGGFFVRRFGRLWPLHAFMLALFVAVEALKLVAAARGAQMTSPPFTGTSAPGTILPNLLLVHSLGFHDYLAWNVPSWSISTEFWTYVVFAALSYVSGRHRTALAVLVIATSLGIVGAFSTRGMDVTNTYGFWRCLAGFFAGVLALEAWRRTEALRERLAGHGALVEWGALALVVAFTSLAGRTTLSFAAPAVFAAVVYAFSMEAGPLSRLLTTRPMLAIGAWSYSIYMVNAFIVLMIIRVVNTLERSFGRPLSTTTTVDGVEHKILELGPKWMMDLIALAYLGAVLAMSWITYRLIEDPARRLFNRLADRWTSRDPLPVRAATPVAPRRLSVE